MTDDAHDSMRRLLGWAQQHPTRDGQVVESWGDLRRALEVSSAVMTNWKRRGISQQGALMAEEQFGCPAAWLIHGGPDPSTAEGHAYWTSHQHSYGGLRGQAVDVAQIVSLPTHSHAPLIGWEQLMQDELPTHFRVTVPDDALAPDLHPGDELEFDRSLAGLAQAGDLILVRDQDGAMYVRYLRKRTASVWSVCARNPAYEDLDVHREGLAIMAVCTVEVRRRRRSQGG